MSKKHPVLWSTANMYLNHIASIVQANPDMKAIIMGIAYDLLVYSNVGYLEEQEKTDTIVYVSYAQSSKETRNYQ